MEGYGWRWREMRLHLLDQCVDGAFRSELAREVVQEGGLVIERLRADELVVGGRGRGWEEVREGERR